MTHLPHNLALRLKALGFDKPTRDYVYRGDTGNNVDLLLHTEKAINHNEDELCVSLPTYAEFFAWCREVHGIDSWVEPYYSASGKVYGYTVWNVCTSYESYPTHPAAEQALAEKLIGIIESKTEGK